MKKLLIFSLLLFCGPIFSQDRINRDNYYSFYKGYEDYKSLKLERLGTSRLSDLEIAEILYQEMKSAGMQWINNYRIIHLDHDNYVLSVCYSEKSNFGFVLETAFDAIPDKSNRDVKSLSKKQYGYDYCEKIMDADGKSDFIKIRALPENLFLIKKDLYWYQTTENEAVNKTLVTKNTIISIFREDIRDILKSVKSN